MPADLTANAAKDIKDPPLWAFPLGEYVMATARRAKVMLVTRSCAIDKPSTKHFLIAPVISVTELPEAARTEANLGFLRSNDIFDWFYLPETLGLSESFADLSQMTPIHWSFVGEKPNADSFISRLSSSGTSALQNGLSDFYGTKFGFTFKDKCTQRALYRCSSCFYFGRHELAQKSVEAGEFFGECSHCGQRALWVKMPESDAQHA